MNRPEPLTAGNFCMDLLTKVRFLSIRADKK
nr:MAG TPA: hypothetical protein [Caudoviricetes sp.]